jgi:hypothetical protein
VLCFHLRLFKDCGPKQTHACLREQLPHLLHARDPSPRPSATLLTVWLW